MGACAGVWTRGSTTVDPWLCPVGAWGCFELGFRITADLFPLLRCELEEKAEAVAARRRERGALYHVFFI